MAPVFNYDASLRRMGNDGQLFREMIGLLQEDSPRLFRELEKSVEERNAQKVRHAAHTLKSLSANFSAVRVINAAEKIEQLARSTTWDEIPAAVRELDQALDELIAALQPLHSGSTQPV
jgi:HPt (histidine-containing phosphotransfer) domain-containing protein